MSTIEVSVVVSEPGSETVEIVTQGPKGDKGDKGDPGVDGAVVSVNGEDGDVVLDADDLDDSATTHKFASAAQLADIATNKTHAESSHAPSDAEANLVDSVNSQMGAVVLDADDIADSATTNKFATAAQLSQIATNQAHSESAHAPSNAEQNATAASQAEMEMGTEASLRSMSPLRVAQAIAALSTGETNDVDSVNGQTGTVVLDADDLDDSATTHKFANAAQLADISTNKTHVESAHAPSDAEANPSVVSQEDAEAGTATDERIWTAERVKQAILALETGEPNPVMASQAEAEAGTLASARTFTPERIAQAIAALASGGGGAWTSITPPNLTSSLETTLLAFDTSSFPTLATGDAYQIRTTINATYGNALVQFWTRDWTVSKDVVALLGVNTGTNVNADQRNVAHDFQVDYIITAFDGVGYPEVKVKDADGTQANITWSLVMEYRKVK